ncbi:MAG: type III-B CRISPR-associated protein Cas10/Cmr2 [Bacteroidia bacterium]|nr:type III-B CRISPR-associated protein Cas10/Cmr2 [Bacteroidia bacterium]MDW8157472.1 type III-B CRISPR-associated protein Cas10/Cmr2 [Bacteroidia bacterium]
MPQEELYLYLLTIGPVQRFIAGARKTTDLFNSSRLLSDLIGCAANFILENYKSQIIYPDKNIESKPNRLVAIITTEDPIATGKNIELRVRTELKLIAEEIYKIAFAENSKLVYEIELYQNYLQQVENHLEVFWVFYLPVEKSINYAENHKTLQSILGSIKNARPFRQLIEEGRKCVLTGEHNALFIGNVRKEEFPAYFSGWAVNNRQIGKKETLGAIGLIKRFYHQYQAFSTDSNKGDSGDGKDETKKKMKVKFPSITEITHLHLQEIEAYREFYKKLEKYSDFVDSDYIIYNPTLEENLQEELHCSEEEFQELKILHAELWKALKEKNKNLTKYYALIMFDGDSMGKWLGAENCKKEVKEEKLEAYHAEFSKLLGEYARKATAYLDGLSESPNEKRKAFGKTIYAGGDDFLGFINLAYFWEIIKYLRISFEEEINQKLRDYKKESENLTFSAGVVIAHYKEPLQQVVELCRSQEKKAKDFKTQNTSKNALSVLICKHAGEVTEFTIPWYSDKVTTSASAANTIDCILEIKEAFQARKLTKNFIHTTACLLNSLEQADPETTNFEKSTMLESINDQIIESIFRYSLKRNPEKIAKQEREILISSLIMLWQATGKSISSFLGILQTIDFIEREL